MTGIENKAATRAWFFSECQNFGAARGAMAIESSNPMKGSVIQNSGSQS